MGVDWNESIVVTSSSEMLMGEVDLEWNIEGRARRICPLYIFEAQVAAHPFNLRMVY